MDKSSSLGMPMSPQEISKRYKRQGLGMPRGTPSSLAKMRSSFKTLYFYCFVFYVFFLERLYFCFQFSFVLFAAINGWTPTYFFWRRRTPFFIAKPLWSFGFWLVTPLYALVNNVLSLCMIMTVIGRSQSFASLHLYWVWALLVHPTPKNQSFSNVSTIYTY
jgi:hypothetical protein